MGNFIVTLYSICYFQHEKYEYENTEGLTKDGSESTEGLSREELGRLVASRWTGDKTGQQVEEIASAKDNNGGKSETSESTHDEQSSVRNDLKGSSGTYMSGSEEQKDLPG